MIKAVLFDLDNTLVDFMVMKRGCVEAAVAAMIKAGLKLGRKKAVKILYQLYDKYGIEYNRIFQKFLQKTGKKIDYRILAAGIVAYRKAQPEFMQPYKNTIPTLQKLKRKGLKLAIVSDAPRLKAWMRLTELKIRKYFDVVVAHGDVSERKPSKMPFRKALASLKLRPEEVLMVGDWPARDIVGAKRLGIKTCFARYGYQFNRGLPKKGKSGADWEINGISELLKIV
jgi:putative hydrolase of the HAD superfamily